MNYKDFEKIRKKNTKKKKIENIEWDSLCHLAILTDLEKGLGRNSSKLPNLSDATNFKKLLKALKKNNLVSK